MPIPVEDESALPLWAPTLSQVAVHAPWLTISLSNPGSQDFLNTFTSDTSPSDDVAWIHVGEACALVGASVSAMPEALYPIAATVAARYAAATLAAAYARTDEDARRAAAILVAAESALKNLIESADNAGVAVSSPAPVMYAPDPVPWGDSLLLDTPSGYAINRQFLYPE